MTHQYLRPKRRFGQHFLEDTWVRKVVASIAPKATDHIVEIGPGRGALTFPLAAQAHKLLAIEIDRTLANGLIKIKNGTIDTIQADFLELDLVAIAKEIYTGHGSIRVVGNLPYNISAPIVLRLLRHAHSNGISDATIMLQREVGERVIALPGSKNYGPLAVMASLHSVAKRLLDLPPGAFRPRPKVHSTLIHLQFHQPKLIPSSFEQFESFTRQLFTQRRKQISNALSSAAFGRSFDPRDCCSRANLDPSRRPAELQLAELIDLYEVVAFS